ncbi:YqiA/YcfP family alpha/beta fold hydrolase [Leptolyngbya ohadii]|uniref:YqiA/YcfP family alpha/beta fold hydrolase n=1 Tax=Leptolyngbya ohadii TaxID=1962290 RepID=UPI0021F0F6A6|nr:YqiA/YcfP family alpha/beta fold hydrolase [Leptolyngbya ohadii]
MTYSSFPDRSADNLRRNFPDHACIYLHGFASSPRSKKAQDLRDRFQAIGIDLITPDLNQPTFSDLTLSRQIAQVEALLPVDRPVTLIGSSFGGLTAAWCAERYAQIERLILLAPAFQFLAQWLPRLGESTVQQWQTQDLLMTYHYGEQEMLPLRYRFVTDAMQYDETQLQRSIPTLILHGIHDDVISIQASRDYARGRLWARLVELDSDHALADVGEEIWGWVNEWMGKE